VERRGPQELCGKHFDVVIPTVGRPSLPVVVGALARTLPQASRLIVVDDRPAGAAAPRLVELPDDPRLVVLHSGGRGPAAARNLGWRAAAAAWVAFVDDDVDVPLGWVRHLEADLEAVGPDVGAVQGRIRVPLAPGRPPTDWERNVGGLEHARWITADLAVRRDALAAVGGFDERFPRAYREDADFALRLLDHGWRLERGRRLMRHPVRPAPWWVSVRLQRGNADDVLIEELHGRGWRARLGVAPGAFAAHRVTVMSGLAALVAGAARRRRLAALAGTWWLARTARFAWRRIGPGPRDVREVLAMTATSVLIPPTAVFHRLRGYLRRYATWLGSLSARPSVPRRGG